MANKYSVLRKNFIKEGIVLSVVVVILAALGLLLQNYSEDTQSEQHNKESDVAAMRGKLAQINREMEMGQSQIALYNKYIASHNPDFTLNRESATKWLVSQREKFHIVNLSITIPPFSEVKDSVATTSGTLIKSEVKLSFDALTDNSVFALIQEMQKSMPGMIIMQEIKITRTGDITGATLMDLNAHKVPSLVTADLSFSWLGLRPETKNPATGAMVSGGNGPAGGMNAK